MLLLLTVAGASMTAQHVCTKRLSLGCDHHCKIHVGLIDKLWLGMAGRLVFFKFQIRLSLHPLRDGPALLAGKKLPLKTVITFFELDKARHQ